MSRCWRCNREIPFGDKGMCGYCQHELLSGIRAFGIVVGVVVWLAIIILVAALAVSRELYWIASLWVILSIAIPSLAVDGWFNWVPVLLRWFIEKVAKHD